MHRNRNALEDKGRMDRLRVALGYPNLDVDRTSDSLVCVVPGVLSDMQRQRVSDMQGASEYRVHSNQTSVHVPRSRMVDITVLFLAPVLGACGYLLFLVATFYKVWSMQ
jgi:hypothetical protein